MGNIIDYLVKTKKIRQVDIAKSLEVSRAQITKWKNGEHLPSDRESELLKMAGLFGDSYDWALLVKSESNGKKWCDIFQYCNEYNDYPSDSIKDMPEIEVQYTLELFQKAGCTIPEAIDIAALESDSEQPFFFEVIQTCIYAICRQTYWISFYLMDWNNSKFDELSDYVYNIESVVSKLAFAELREDDIRALGGDISSFRSMCFEGRNEASWSVREYVKRCNSLGMQISVDPFELIHTTSEHLLDEDDFCSVLSSKHIESYLDIASKKILESNIILSHQLAETNMKLDLLLSEPQKVELDKVLEYFPPCKNPLLQQKP